MYMCMSSLNGSVAPYLRYEVFGFLYRLFQDLFHLVIWSYSEQSEVHQSKSQTKN